MLSHTTQMIDQDLLVAKVKALLETNEASYKLISHDPEGNCEKVSVMRGNHIHAAAKALLIQVKITAKQSNYVLAILPGDNKVNFKEIAKQFNAKSAGMADKTKVEALLNCEIGRVPPFSFHKEVKVIVDSELVDDNELIYFSPGRLDVSMEMKAAAYRQIILNSDGIVFNFSNKMESSYQSGATLFTQPTEQSHPQSTLALRGTP